MSKLFIKREYKNAKEIDSDFFCEEDLGTENKKSETGDEFLGKHLSENKINAFLLVVIICIIIIFGRTFHLPIYAGYKY